MISGSFVASLLFSKSLIYDDFDLYFTTKKDLYIAIKLLNKSVDFELHYKTKRANTYLHLKKNIKIQIIKKIHPTPHHLVYAHDFHNCGVAYCSKQASFYLSKEALHAWANDLLMINKTPLQSKHLPDFHYFQTIGILLKRIQKYTSRYSLKLDDTSKNNIDTYRKKCTLKIKEYPDLFSTSTFVDYAGNTYSFQELIYNEICVHEL
jgi:hypothetical protein